MHIAQIVYHAHRSGSPHDALHLPTIPIGTQCLLGRAPPGQFNCCLSVPYVSVKLELFKKLFPWHRFISLCTIYSAEIKFDQNSISLKKLDTMHARFVHNTMCTCILMFQLISGGLRSESTVGKRLTLV